MSSFSLLRSTLVCASILVLGVAAQAQTSGTGTSTGTGTATGTGTGGSTTTAPKSAAGAKSQAVVYHLTFSPSGTSINFRNYTNAYYVADLPVYGSGGTLIVTQVVGGVRKFYTYEDFGGMFIAVKGSDKKGVIVGSRTSGSSSSSSSTTAGANQNITLYAIGDAKGGADITNRDVGGTAKALFPTKLEGTAIFVDSMEDYPFAFAPGADVGSAGKLDLTATYDEGMSANSLVRNYSRNGVVASIWALLVSQGYTNASASTGSGTATGTATGTSTGTVSGPFSTGN